MPSVDNSLKSLNKKQQQNGKQNHSGITWIFIGYAASTLFRNFFALGAKTKITNRASILPGEECVCAKIYYKNVSLSNRDRDPVGIFSGTRSRTFQKSGLYFLNEKLMLDL